MQKYVFSSLVLRYRCISSYGIVSIVCAPSLYAIHITSQKYCVKLTAIHTVSQRNDTDVAHYNFDADQPILIIFLAEMLLTEYAIKR